MALGTRGEAAASLARGGTWGGLPLHCRRVATAAFLAAGVAGPTPEIAVQNHPRSTGNGSSEASRGSVHVVVPGEKVTGEVDVTGTDIDPSSAGTITPDVVETNTEAAADSTALSPATDPALSGVGWSGDSWS